MKLRIFLLLLALSLFPGTPQAGSDLGRGRTGDILYVHYPPDPVNVRNGNFYLPVQDYYLPCFGFPLEVYRSYNSLSTRNGPMGKGWTFNYDVHIVVGDGAGIRVTEPDGFVNEYIPLEAEEGNRSAQIEKIVAARKKEDEKYTKKASGKGKAFYEKYRKRLEDDLSFFGRQRTLYLGREAMVSKSGKYVSRQRGTTYLDKSAKGYVRTHENGRQESYDTRGQLIRVSDRNGNKLTLDYNAKGHLIRVNDSCQQSLHLSLNKRGKIIQIADSLTRKLLYTYDGEDHLVSATSLEGEKTSFRYDKTARMIGIVFQDGAKTDITYDGKTGYATKQIGPGTKVTTYQYGKAGQRVWAIVTDNEGMNNRYEYDDAAHTITFTDLKSRKKTVTTVSECCGKPISIRNEKGEGESFVYDEKGNLTSRTDALKRTTTFKYEPRFNLVSQIQEPDGTSLRFVYDAKGNLTYSSSSNKQHVKLVYEKHGKIQEMTDHRENKIIFTYNKFGKPTSIQKLAKKKEVGAIRVIYDKKSEIVKVDYEPKNPEVIQEVRSTLASFLRLLKPSGIDFEI